MWALLHLDSFFTNHVITFSILMVKNKGLRDLVLDPKILISILSYLPFSLNDQ